jgi:cell division protein FtsN
VQVFAGRDRTTAESLVKSLAGRGYSVKLEAQREGTDALYKVRVGGYLTPDAARDAAARLKKEGEAGAWVTQVR